MAVEDKFASLGDERLKEGCTKPLTQQCHFYEFLLEKQLEIQIVISEQRYALQSQLYKNLNKLTKVEYHVLRKKNHIIEHLITKEKQMALR